MGKLSPLSWEIPPALYYTTDPESEKFFPLNVSLLIVEGAKAPKTLFLLKSINYTRRLFRNTLVPPWVLWQTY